MPAHELVNPNLHVVLVHFPIALLITGTLIELLSFLGWRGSGFRVAGRWMIFMGALLAIPTSLAGLYALSDVVRMQNPAAAANGGATWNQTLAASPVTQNPQAWDMLQRHAFLNGGVTALLAFVVLVWVSGSDAWRRKLHFPLMILLLAGVGATVVSAWYGGEVVYRKGVGVMEGQAMKLVPPEQAPAGGSRIEELAEKPSTNPAALSPATAPARTREAAHPTAATTSPAAEEQMDVKRDIERAFPPLQSHVILAGFAVSAALAAMGLSLRAAGNARAASAEEPVDELSDLAALYGARPVRPGREPGPADESRGPSRAGALDHIPSSRLWLLTSLFALLAAAAGFWVLVRGDAVQNLVDFAGIWNHHIKLYERRMFHVIAGVSIIVLPLLLALIARAAPRARGLIFLLSMLLIAAVAAQVWLGILLMWDTPSGGVKGFNVAG